MTSHYVDLTLLPDAETGVPALLGVVYNRLHRALVQQRMDSLGVSFPKYRVNPRDLGDTLRLHASEATLQSFVAEGWLRGMRDHVRVANVGAAPADAQHRCVYRRQFQSNVERLRRRRMKRKGETAEQAAQAIPDTAQQKPTLPYAHLRSLSTDQKFCLFIAMGPLQVAPVVDAFNTYGLSNGRATIPWF
jgi:CRISPR-associated endonuclease Csy4